MKQNDLNTRRLAVCGVLAAVYAAVTIATSWMSYGTVQFRISEALCVLPFFLPYTSAGLFLGCLIANIFSTVSAIDIVVGSLATLIGCVWTGKLKNKWLIPLPTVAANWVLVGAMLAYVLSPDSLIQGFLLFGAQVAVGEMAVMVLLGMPLALFLERTGLCRKLDGQADKKGA